MTDTDTDLVPTFAALRKIDQSGLKAEALPDKPTSAIC